MKLTYTLEGERVSVEVPDLDTAARIYCEARDASGVGASDLTEGTVRRGKRAVARISYNGRIWHPRVWREGDLPLSRSEIAAIDSPEVS